MSTDIFIRSWSRLANFFDFSEDKRKLINQLLQAYEQPQRYYHTLQHLGECLQWLEAVYQDLQNPSTVELALWFHDVIYEPTAKDNEERSADLFCTLFENHLSPELVQQVCYWILCTKKHQSTTDHDLKILLDIDLAILGASSARFFEYEIQIQHEYSWVDFSTYRSKRAQILNEFYQQTPLYQTHFFQDKLEQQAKQNLENYLKILRV